MAMVTFKGSDRRERFTAGSGFNNTKVFTNTFPKCQGYEDWYFLHKPTGKRAPFSCRRWSCPVCGPKRSRDLFRRISRSLIVDFYCRGFRKIYFLTTTLDPKRIRGDRFEFFRSYWAKLLVYLRRWAQGHNVAGKRGRQSFPHHRPRPFHFVKAVGIQEKTLNPHLHLLTNLWITKSRLKRISWRLGGGFEVDIQPVDLRDLKGAANRVAQYMCSQQLLTSLYVANNLRPEDYHSAPFPRYFKRATSSRTISLFFKSLSEDWVLIGPKRGRPLSLTERVAYLERRREFEFKLWFMPPPDGLEEQDPRWDPDQTILAHPAEIAKNSKEVGS